MSCDLSIGRKEECKDNVGGIKAIYFVNYSPELYSTSGKTEVDLIFAIPSFLGLIAYKYELKGVNSYEEENVKSQSTSSYNQTATIYLKKQNATTLKELKMLSYGRPHAIIEDKNGNLRLAGYERGLDVQVNNSTGASLEEDNGYSITITGSERFPAPFMDIAILNGGSSQFTVVEGTN